MARTKLHGVLLTFAAATSSEYAEITAYFTTKELEEFYKKLHNQNVNYRFVDIPFVQYTYNDVTKVYKRVSSFDSRDIRNRKINLNLLIDVVEEVIEVEG